MIDKIFYIIVGSAATWIFQQYRVARSEETVLINEHIKDIERLSDALMNYWLAEPNDQSQEVSLAARVRAAHASLTLPYPDICKICDSSAQEYKSLCLELFDHGLGGSFETAGRAADVLRAISCADTAAQTIDFLRKVRMDVISLSRIRRAALVRTHNFWLSLPASLRSIIKKFDK